MILCLLLSGCGQSAADTLVRAAREDSAAGQTEASIDTALPVEQELEEDAVDQAILDQAARITGDIAALTLGPEIGPELDRIESDYAALSEDARGYVQNYDVLQGLRSDYDVAMGLVQEAEYAIDEIGVIDENSMDDIEFAQYCYDQVDPDFQSAVSNRDMLNGAYEECQQAIRDKGAADTQALIDAGQYQEAMDYAEAYIYDHQNEMGSQTELATLQQTAELYLAWQYYNGNYLEDTQDILDHLKGDAITDELYDGAVYLQDKMDSWLIYNEPSNGKILSSSISGGYGELTINSGSHPMLIKVERTSDPYKYIYLYVRADSSATINVPDGDYVVKYASGDIYYGSGAEKPFGRSTSYTQADDILEFDTTYSGNYVYYSTIMLTLYAVEGGNMSTYSIDPDSF